MSLQPPAALETAGEAPRTSSDDENPFPSPETLRVVADETRQTILAELDSAPDAPLQFSDLRRRVDVEQSARFNYHLQELLGLFVRETAAGYELTPKGERFLHAIRGAPRFE